MIMDVENFYFVDIVVLGGDRDIGGNKHVLRNMERSRMIDDEVAMDGWL